MGNKPFHKKHRRVCGLVFRYMPSITKAWHPCDVKAKLPPPTTIPALSPPLAADFPRGFGGM